MLRALGTLCCLLVAAGCAGPHSTGALWSVQNVDRERALGRLSPADQADKVQALEYGVADEALAAERARLDAQLDTCPGPLQPLTASTGDRTRDAIRLQARDDAARLSAVAQLALADWRIRRARATADAQFCDAARTALAGAVSRTASNLLDGLPIGTVTRDETCSETAQCFAALARAESGKLADPQASRGAPLAMKGAGLEPQATDDPTVALSEYALGYVDEVRAAAPLPQYLAVVYGGHMTEETGGPLLDTETAAKMVDRDASAYPQWEPDALYAALTGGKR